MVCRKFLAWLKGPRKGDTERTNATVLQRPQSQLGASSSGSTPTLPRRKSDGGATLQVPSVSGHHLPVSGTTGDATPQLLSVSENHLPVPGATVDPGPHVPCVSDNHLPVLDTTGGATSGIPAVPDNHPPISNVGGSKPAKLSSYVVDPAAAYEKKPAWKSTVDASASLAVGLLKESSNAFTPLMSVFSCLSIVLKYYDQTVANRETIKSLLPRIEGLAESLSTSAPEGEIKEIMRRQKLKEKLDKILPNLELFIDRGKITGFLNNVKYAETLTGLAQDIRDAMMDYQTTLQQDIHHKNYQLTDVVERSLLNGMHHTADAGFLYGNRRGCLKGTRKEVLLQIEQWLVDEKDQRIFWLNGLAGTGKSTIAQTIAEISFADGKLGASFFCSQNHKDRSNLQAIFSTLAFQLAHRYPQFRKQLVQVLETNLDVGQESPSSQLEKIIVRPFAATKIPTLIIIDAPDECKENEPTSALLSMLSRHVHEIPEVKFFITDRPEPSILEGFRLKSLRPITDVLKLYDVKLSSVDEDTKLYLRTHLVDIRKTRSDCEFPDEWPSSYDIDILCKMAGGFSTYASTIVKFVASSYHLPPERLACIISLPQDTTHQGIDLIYTQILEQTFSDADPGEEEIYSDFRNVVGAVLLAFYPLSSKALSNLVRNCETPSQISTTLRFLHSLLNVPDSADEPIRVFHKSFPEFLTDPTRCKDERFFVDPSVHHEDILFSCLDLMKKRLKKNICDLDDYAVLSKVEDLPARREIYIDSSLEYACRFWTRHLASIPGDGPRVKQVQEMIDEFFTKHLLHWIEALSTVGHPGTAVYAINDIRQWYISAGIPTYEPADDSERLIAEYFDAIQDSPSHVYHSALPLSPSSSWVRKCYEAEITGEARVFMGLPDRWDTCFRTITFGVKPSTFAYRRDIIAVGLGSDVVLFDGITGSRTSLLSGHTDVILSVAFSLDGARLVSSGEDRTVKLWDVETGGVIRSFSCCTSSISSISIAPDYTTIASGTWTGAIRLWDVQSGAYRSIETHQGDVSVVSFSPIDSHRLASSSLDGTVQQWDIDGNRIGTPCHEAHRVDDLAYALGGTRFVSCGGKVATVRDSESGAVIAKLNAPDRTSLYRCCFSPDGRFVACAADTIIYVWDITSEPRLVGRLVGHTDTITFLTFSSSLISGSRDQSIKFWQSSNFLSDSTTAGGTAALHGSTPIASVNLFPGDGTVVTSDDSGVVSTWDLTTGSRKTSSSTPAKGIRDTHLADDTLLVVWWVDGEKQYHIWDVGNDQLLRKVYSLLSAVKGLKVSGDGTKIFGLGDGRIEVRCAQTGKYVGGAWLEGGIGSGLIVHGSKVEYEGKKGWGWNFGGQEASDFGELPDRPCLDVIDWSDGRRVKPRWIEDTVTGRRVFRLPERYMKSDTEIRWDGRYLLVWSRSGDVLVIDFNSVCPR